VIAMPPDPFDAVPVQTAVDNPAGVGPFETERQARELPAVREVYRQFGLAPAAGKMTPHNLRMLCEALSAAGVELGGYDHAIAAWMAGWEPEVVAVIAGWVQRARQADDQSAARADALLARPG
jgi:hypothetical protein